MVPGSTGTSVLRWLELTSCRLLLFKISIYPSGKIRKLWRKKPHKLSDSKSPYASWQDVCGETSNRRGLGCEESMIGEYGSTISPYFYGRRHRLSTPHNRCGGTMPPTAKKGEIVDPYSPIGDPSRAGGIGTAGTDMAVPVSAWKKWWGY